MAVAYRYQDTRVSCIGRYSYVCDFVDRTDPAARVPTRYTDEWAALHCLHDGLHGTPRTKLVNCLVSILFVRHNDALLLT